MPTSFFKEMESFASNGLLQIIVELFWLKSGNRKSLPASPLTFIAPQETSLWNSGIWRAQHILWPVKSKQQSSCPFATRLSPLQRGTPQCEIAPCEFTQAAHLIYPWWTRMPLAWTSHVTVWFHSAICPPGQPNPKAPLLPLGPGLSCACQTPYWRQGTTDPGDPWEQGSPGGAMSNLECFGQLPRLCSNFWCSLESSHYITKRSTIKL